MKALLSAACACACLLCLPSAARAQDPTIAYSTTSSTGSVGDTVSATIRALDFGTPVSYQWAISWDPAIAKFAEIVNLAPDLAAVPSQFSVGLIDTAAGRLRVTYFENAVAVSHPPAFDMFDVRLKLVASGTTTSVMGESSSPTFFAKEYVPGSGPFNPDFPVEDNTWTINVTGGGGGTPGGGGGDPCDGLTGTTIHFTDTTAAAGAPACVSVYAHEWGEVVAFNFVLDYDPAIVTSLDTANVNPKFSADPADDFQFSTMSTLGTVLFTGNNDIALDTCERLFDLCFTVGAGGLDSTAIGVNTSVARSFESFAEGDFTGSMTYSDGEVKRSGTTGGGPGGGGSDACDGLTAPTIVFADTLVAADADTTCVPVYAYQVSPVASFDFAIAFDALVLAAPRLERVSAVLNVPPNDLLFSTMSTQGTVVFAGIDEEVVPDCERLFDICFDVVGDPGDSTLVEFDAGVATNFENFGGPFAVADAAGLVKIDTAGGVTPVVPAPCDTFTGPTVYIQRDTADLDAQSDGCLAVIGYDLGDVTAFSFPLAFDGTVVTFTGIADVTASLAGSVTADAGANTVSYAGAAVDLSACDTLFRICFDLVGNPEDETDVALGPGTSITATSGAVASTTLAGGWRLEGTSTPPCPALSLTATPIFPTCNGDDDGAINVEVSGGDGSYTYVWADGPTTEDRTGLTAGTYMVTVTSCGGDSTAMATVVVGQPDALGGSAVITPTTCNGGADGAIDLTPTGGTAPYGYDWTGPGTVDGQQDQSGLAAGTYTLLLSDDNACSTTLSFDVMEPTPVTVSGSVSQPSGGLANGAIDVTASGGVGGYSYAWTGTGVVPNAEDQTGLLPGTYTVVATDSDGCASAVVTFTLTEGAPSLTIASTPACPGTNSGSIDLTVTGGTPPFDFDWSDGLPNQEDHAMVGAGFYTVTVTDDNGMTANTSVSVGEHPAVTLTADVTPDRGNGDGAIDLSVSGGSGADFDYLWSNGSRNQDLPAVAQGQYSVTVTDRGTGCTFDATFDVPLDIAPVACEVSSTDLSCNAANGGSCDGTLTLTVSSGLAPINVTITGDDIGAPATFVFTAVGSQTWSGLCAGTVTVMVSDATGSTCSQADVTIAEPPALTITGAIVRPVVGAGAANGLIDITVEGGTPPYSYQWSSGSSNEDNAGLPVGNYSVTVTDDNGCTFSSAPYQVDRLRVVSADVIDVRCGNTPEGRIDIEVAGGAGPYEYEWSNGATTQDLPGVTAGTYTVTIRDVPSGAELFASYTVRSQSDLVVTAQVDSDYNGAQVSCPDAADATARAFATGGAGPVVFEWSTGTPSSNGLTVAGLPAGTHTVTGRDTLGCQASFAVTVTPPEPVTVGLTVDDIRCFGQANGRITAQGLGGTGALTYEWSTGDFGRVIATQPAGTYTVTVTDENGCTEEASASVAEPDSIVFSVAVAAAAGPADPGAITFFPRGGTAPYTYLLDGGASPDSVIADLVFGEYVAQVRDANGCVSAEQVVLVNQEGFDCFTVTNVITPFTIDGKNDVLAINCIEGSPDNSVEVFNRWGQLVFEADGYDNDAVAFRGLSESGNELPEGGYFYVLRYRDANNDQQLIKGSFNVLR